MKEGWEEKKLGDVCEEITDGSHFSPKSTNNEKYPYVTVRDIVNDEIDFINCKFINEEDYQILIKNGCKPNLGDILFSKDGTVGKVSLINYEKEFVVLSSLAIIRPNHKLIDPYFLKYVLKSPEFIKTAIGQKTGVAIRRIILKNLKQICVNYPKSLEEQKKIVAILDEAFAAIDEAKANIQKNIENAGELFQSRLNEIFSQKGEDWEEKKLGEVCENLDSKRIPITKNIRKNGLVPYYGASGIVDYVENYIFDEELLLVSEDGANLLARTYPIAFSISGKTWVNNHAHVLKFKEITSQIFIEYYLNSIKLDDYVSGMAQPKLNQKMLNSIVVPFPSMDIQEKVVNQLDSLSEEITIVNEKNRVKINLLDELKKSLLQKAFAGELT